MSLVPFFQFLQLEWQLWLYLGGGDRDSLGLLRTALCSEPRPGLKTAPQFASWKLLWPQPPLRGRGTFSASR